MKNAPHNSTTGARPLIMLFAIALLLAGTSLSALAQSTDYWTTTANASATEDESNPAKPTYTNQTAAVNGGPTGLYILRYNLSAVDGLFNTANGFMRLRVRDNGTGANVLVVLKRSNVAAGGIETIATFDSDSLTASSGFQTPANVLFTHTFDFTNYVYWLDVTLNRIDATGQPGFAGAIIGN
jgi:hypothetical protein